MHDNLSHKKIHHVITKFSISEIKFGIEIREKLSDTVFR